MSKETNSDKGLCMANLAAAQIPLMEWMSRACINHTNGNMEKYKMVKEQLDRLDKMILALK